MLTLATAWASVHRAAERQSAARPRHPPPRTMRSSEASPACGAWFSGGIAL